ncbi:MAG: hypothetical protein E7E22_05160, partial [Actinomyces sp.]|nr:hypothetical protein [Actinomyces sp.]
PHSDSETSTTTSPEHSSKPEDSDPNYTLNYEEPLYMAYNMIFDLIESAIRAQGQLNEIRLTIANIVEAIIRGVAARA